MATRRAVANGNWSSTSTWNGGVLPGPGDTVYANGFNLAINQNVDIGGANNPSVNAGSFVAGQYYTITFVGTTSWTAIGAASNTLGVTFLATGVGSGTGTATALATISTLANTAAGAAAGGNFAITTANTFNADIRAGTTACLTISGAGNMTLSNLNLFGGSAASALAVQNNSTGTLSVTNCMFFGGSSTPCINNANAGTISINSSFLNASTNAAALNNASNGNITISSSALTGGAGASATAVALNNASNGNITISSSTLTGGNQNAVAVNNVSTGNITISSSTLTGGYASGGAALNNLLTGTVICTGCTFTASAFSSAVNIANTGADVRLSGDFLDHWSGWRAVTGGKWRLGTAPTLGQTRYALAGTTDSYHTQYGADYAGFGNPIAADVRSGVSYGGGNLTGTCAVPAPSSVSAGVAVDATVGTAVLDGASVATAVWSATTRTITGGTVDTLTNAPESVTPSDIWSHATRTLTSASGPTAAEIRAEMDSNSTKLTAIKAVTDDLDPITERLANCATTNIVGVLLAQAQS